MATAVQPNPFVNGYRLLDGLKLNNALARGLRSSQDGITAFSGGGLTGAIPLTAVISRVSTVANPNDSVKLMSASAGAMIVVDNDGANNLAVYPNGTDQIEDSTSAVTLLPGQDVTFVCPTKGKWYQLGSTGAYSGTFTGTLNNVNIASIAAAQTGTFTALTGGGPVTVANTSVTANSGVLITLKTVGGTVGSPPIIKTITAGTGFTVTNTAGDTSIYNYTIIG
jgi:hypothetical protein